MWTGRFQQDQSAALRDFTESVSFDRRLAPYDILGSTAHAGALRQAGILSEDDHAAIVAGLREIGEDIAAGRFAWDPALEDVHMNIEAELTRRIGPAGARLHTARSRNDQVALDFRLYCRDAARRLVHCARDLQRTLVALADGHRHVLMPGYTHLQRAQPVPLSHHLLAYVEMLERDVRRLNAAGESAAVSPLGSGALAGSTIVLDREAIARDLGLPAITRNSMDAVSDRDFACELLFAIALCGIHLSRLSEDIVLWSATEFGFLLLPDAFATGSSLMPQKKNPDAAELVRGKSGRLVGHLMTLLTLLKGLPMTYNRDLQEDKPPVFDAVDTLAACLGILAAMLAEARFHDEAMAAAAADPALLATDLADFLVQQGIPFRNAHEHTGRLVALAEQRGTTLAALSPADYRDECAAFGEHAPGCLDVRRSMRARTAPGAPAPQNVAAEIDRWKTVLKPGAE